MSVSQMADRPPLVQFEYRAEEDRDASIKEGHPVFKNVAFVKITPAGGNLVVDRVAEDWLAHQRAQRSPFYDLFQRAFDAWLKGEEIPVDGTALKLCSAFSPAEVKQCTTAGIRSVEDLAAYPDGEMPRLGIGGVRLKQKAATWLAAANDTGKAAAQIEAATVKIAELERQVAEKDETIRQLQAQVDALAPKKRAAA